MKSAAWAWLSLLLGAVNVCAQTPAPEEKIVRPGLKEVQRPYSLLKPTASFQVGENADWVVIGEDSVWVAGAKPFSLKRIDPSSNKVTGTLNLAGEACSGLEIAFGSVWVPLCTEKPSLARIDLRTNQLAVTLEIGPAAPEGGIAASKDSVWLVTSQQGVLSRIDPSTNTVRQTVKIAPGAINPIFSDGIVWVSSPETNELIAVDADTGTVIEQIPVGPKPQFLTAGAGAIWTLNQGDGTISRVDATSRKVIATIHLGIPGPGGDVCFAAGSVWATIFDVPLTRVEAVSNKVIQQWVGPGGDSLRCGFDALWITDYYRGWLWRIPLEEILKK
jgi:virginiamycin B lyase